MPGPIPLQDPAQRVCRRGTRAQGLTATELLVGLAILCALSAAAMPDLSGMVAGATLRSTTSDFVADAQFARAAAVARNAQVVLCKGVEGCTTAGGWEQGWMVFHDANGNGRADPGEEVLARRQALPAGWRVSGNGPVASYVAYGPVGTTRLHNGGFQAGTLTVCRAGAPAPVAARQVVVNAVGRPRVQAVQLPACP